MLEKVVKVENNFGFIPNLIGNVIESPKNAKEYLALSTVFRETTFTDVERNLVFLAVSRANECEYCVFTHSLIARMGDVPEDAIEAVRDAEALRMRNSKRCAASGHRSSKSAEG